VTPGHTPQYFSDLAAQSSSTFKRMVKETGLAFE
jgi:hypothetical protein